MGKNNEIRLKCSKEDKEKIQRQSDKTGLSLTEFCLKVLLNTEVEIKLKSRGE